MSPPSILPESIEMPMYLVAVTMSDINGNLLFYSNGIQIRNAENELMENGDSLNWCDLTANNYDIGLSGPQTICLPVPSSDSLYYLINVLTEKDNTSPIIYYSKDFIYSTIDITATNGKGVVIEKDVLFGQAGLSAEFPNACKHANGRDWWYVAGDDTASIYYRCLITPEGFLNFDTQRIGYQPPFPEFPERVSQNVFSPDGAKYVDYDAQNGVRIYDFDRCSGLLSNPILITFPDEFGFGIGAAISPNSRFLYVDRDTAVYQFDLWASDIAASIDTVAIYDGFTSPPATPWPTGFYLMQLMPDGKIYIITGSAGYHHHYIANPDEKGDACNVVQHGLELPSRLHSIPTHPNYRLYDLPGSPCDTLGIDGPPVAVKELELPEGEIVLSPNPASGSLHINSVNCAWQPREVVIYDALGREVLHRAHPATVRSFTLSVEGLTAGIYWCKITDGKGSYIVKKLIKQ